MTTIAELKQLRDSVDQKRKNETDRAKIRPNSTSILNCLD